MMPVTTINLDVSHFLEVTEKLAKAIQAMGDAFRQAADSIIEAFEDEQRGEWWKDSSEPPPFKLDRNPPEWWQGGGDEFGMAV